MGWESRNVTGNWNGSGTGPVARSHHKNCFDHNLVDWTQWNRCEHGRPVFGTVPACGVNTA